MNIKDIESLIITINNTDIERVEIEKNDIRLLIVKGNGQRAEITSEPRPIIGSSSIEEDLESKLEDDNLYTIASPMVGVFYQSPSPDAQPFVKLGDRVEKGQTLCIVEAMKIMNEIESELSGEVVEILLQDGDVVEYGQALMKIRRV